MIDRSVVSWVFILSSQLFLAQSAPHPPPLGSESCTILISDQFELNIAGSTSSSWYGRLFTHTFHPNDLQVIHSHPIDSCPDILQNQLNPQLQPSIMANNKRILLSSIDTLTFYDGEYTAFRRTGPVHQLTCKGSPCKRYKPDVIQCRNTGGELASEVSAKTRETQAASFFSLWYRDWYKCSMEMWDRPTYVHQAGTNGSKLWGLSKRGRSLCLTRFEVLSTKPIPVSTFVFIKAEKTWWWSKPGSCGLTYTLKDGGYSSTDSTHHQITCAFIFFNSGFCWRTVYFRSCAMW